MNELATKSAGDISHSLNAPLAPIVQPGSDQMLSLIERVAMNPDADVAKMQALLDMKRGEEDRVAERLFYEAMNSAQSEMGPVVRDRKNDQTKSMYATIEAIAKAIRPIWTRHGFSMSFDNGDGAPDGFYRVTCRVAHGLGHFRDYKADVPIDGAGMAGKVNKTATHAFGSTMQYGRRYLTLMIFDIATSDDDDGNAAAQGGSEPISAEQYQELMSAIEAKGADADDFLKFIQAKGCKAQTLQELTTVDFPRAMADLNAKKAKS